MYLLVHGVNIFLPLSQGIKIFKLDKFIDTISPLCAPSVITARLVGESFFTESGR
jgi:hypothetical protein